MEDTPPGTREHVVVVDGWRTRWLETGAGAPVVLLHGGDYGGGAEVSWRATFAALAERFRVVAPDWLGFGGSDKARDFADPTGRMVRHLGRLLEMLEVGPASFVGASMGGTLLARDAAADIPVLGAERLVLVSGGGFAPVNEHRAVLQRYDGTLEGMRAVVGVLFHDPRFAADDELVEWMHRRSIRPGAWEVVAAAGLRPPSGDDRRHFGLPDPTAYERVRVPTLVVAGAADRLRAPGWGAEIVERLPEGELLVIDECGHYPQLERPDVVNPALVDFLSR